MTKKIGVLGAMPEEVGLFAAGLTEIGKETLAGTEFISGSLGGHRVTVCCAGMGKVNAACAAQLLITVFGAEALVFSGIAGNMTDAVGVGDMVIGSSAMYHDADLRMIAESYPFLREYPADPRMVAAAEKACGELGVRYTTGRIATGDGFVSAAAEKERIRALCHPACVEMEGAAVAQTAAKNDVPFVILRTMSDNCDEAGQKKLVAEQFDITEYCRTASAVTAAVVNRL